MEFEFDREMDALLRKAGAAMPRASGETTASHLDADAVAGFAENALPAAARMQYMTHLADCDSCRNTLSNVIALNTAAEPEAAPSVAAAARERSVPWYRAVFRAPGLAYAMGGMILLFSGFIAYVGVQNFGTIDRASESVREAPAESEVVRTSSAADANAETSATDGEVSVETGLDKSEIGIREVDIARAPVVAATPLPDERRGLALSEQMPPPAAEAYADAARPAGELAASNVAKAAADDDAERRKEAELMAARQQQAPIAGAPPAVQAGPSRRDMQRDNRVLGATEPTERARRPDDATAEETTTREVGGKTFEQRDKVWYDKAYAGQPTTTVRRGSAAYLRLDGALRSITDSLRGTVVVVWQGTAYRIQ
jgi:hypothetical protein